MYEKYKDSKTKSLRAMAYLESVVGVTADVVASLVFVRDTAYLGNAVFAKIYWDEAVPVFAFGENYQQYEQKCPPKVEPQPKMKNPYYTVVGFNGHTTSVWLMETKPSSRIVQLASLIVPPNDIEAIKDRFGLFSQTSADDLFTDDIVYGRLLVLHRQAFE